MAKKAATRRAKPAKAKIKVFKFDTAVVSTLDIPRGSVVARHVEKQDFAIVPLTNGKLRYVVYKGDRVASRGTSALVAGKPKYFAVGADGRDVELTNLGGALKFCKFIAKPK